MRRAALLRVYGARYRPARGRYRCSGRVDPAAHIAAFDYVGIEGLQCARACSWRCRSTASDTLTSSKPWVAQQRRRMRSARSDASEIAASRHAGPHRARDRILPAV
ncbi:MAG: hypothetical protein MZV49_15235 [Rhodopseudomonas palustris]|nr:hypothetical protein [Rhodopseudomonas palustris]